MKHTYPIIAAFLFATTAFAIRIENAAPSSISRTNAIVAGDLVTTNGTTNVVYVTLYWAKSDYTTNVASWTYTNTFSVASTGAVSTNITTLTPATKYYYRWYAIEGTNFDWPAASTNFTTLSGIPTGAPPTVVYHPVMESTNGSLAASTNFFASNTGRLAQAQVVLVPDLAAYATLAQGAAATNAQARVAALDSNLFSTATGVGVQTNAPAAALDINGNLIVRQTNFLFYSSTNHYVAMWADIAGYYVQSVSNGSTSAISVHGLW
jgi:hypothetical protein